MTVGELKRMLSDIDDATILVTRNAFAPTKFESVSAREIYVCKLCDGYTTPTVAAASGYRASGKTEKAILFD